MLGPGEPAAVYDDAPEGRAVAADKLGQRVDDDVGPVHKRLEAQGRSHGVVDDERHPVAVGRIGHRLDVDHVAGRVADALAENSLGVVVDQSLDGLGGVVGRKPGFHALARQDGGEIGISGAVKLGRGHDIGAEAGQVAHRKPHRRRPRAHGDRPHPLLQAGHAPLEHVDRGVVDAVVVKTGGLQVEDRSGVGGVHEIVGHRLVDGDCYRPGAVRRIAAMDGNCLVTHHYQCRGAHRLSGGRTPASCRSGPPMPRPSGP